jgi:hypothetical protein
MECLMLMDEKQEAQKAKRRRELEKLQKMMEDCTASPMATWETMLESLDKMEGTSRGMF